MTNHTESLEEIALRECMRVEGDYDGYVFTIDRLQNLLSDPAILAHIPAYGELLDQRNSALQEQIGLTEQLAALLEENERLKEYQEGYKEAVAESDLAYRNHIADLESQLAALQGGEAVAKCKHGLGFDSRWEDNAIAWGMVVKAISEVMPDWWRLADKGQDAAVAAVKKLAAMSATPVDSGEGS